MTRALAPWVLLAGITPITSATLNYSGRAQQRLPFAIGAVAVNAVVDVVLLPRIGVVAAAIGTDLGIAVVTLGALWLCSKELEYRMRDFLTDSRTVVHPGGGGSRDHGSSRRGDKRESASSSRRCWLHQRRASSSWSAATGLGD